MRRLSGLLLAGVVLLLPAFSQHASAQNAPQKTTYTGDAVVAAYVVNAGKEADYEKVIATLTDKVEFEMELRIAKGRGYVPAAEQYSKTEEQEIGLIPMDAIYSPVSRVRFKVEETRGHVVDGKVAHWQVTIKAGFTLES